MKTTDSIRLFFTTFVMYLPILIVCIVAGVVILLKWRQAASGSVWAMLGFGLALVLCFAMPIGHTLLQYWVFQGGMQGGRIWMYSAFSFVGSLLHALVYALLLVAVFAGRPKPDAVIPPPADEPG
jgi:hypothetical protein